jgi:hypothetical protein
MSKRYDDYFNKLKEQHDELYSAGADLTPSPEDLTNNLIDTDYHGNLYMSDSQHSKRSRNNDKVGGVELLNQQREPDPILPISYYYGKTITPEIKQHLQDANQKQAQQDKMNALLFSQGFGVNPTTGKSTKDSHSLQHDNNHNTPKVKPKNTKNTDKSNNKVDKLVDKGVATPDTKQHKNIPTKKPVKRKPMDDKIKKMNDDSDKLLNRMIKEGSATIVKRKDKVPDRVLKEDAQKKRIIQDKQPLVSKPKPVIRMGYDTGFNSNISTTI